MEAIPAPLFVVVGVDGSPSSEAALLLGIRSAHDRKLPLRVVYVESVATQDAASGKDLVDAHVQRAVRSNVRAQGVVLSGDPVQVLPEQTNDAALVVVGAIGRAGPRHLRLGSVADHLIRQGRCPVIVTPDPASSASAGNQVVVGLDTVGGSSRALTFAFEEASLRGLNLTIVIARPDTVSPRPDVPGRPDQPESRIGALTNDLQMLQKTYPGVLVHTEIHPGNAVGLLVGHARHAALLVVGARQHAGVPGLDYASVSHAVLLDASCPVAVVHD